MTQTERRFGLLANTLVTTVGNLPPNLRVDALGDAGDGVIVTPGRRLTPCAFDAHWLSLIELFERPTSISAAIRTLAARRGEDASQMVDAVWPVVERISRAGFLLAESRLVAENHQLHTPMLHRGQKLDECVVEQSLSTSEDTEVYLLTAEGTTTNRWVAKIARDPGGPPQDPGFQREIGAYRQLTATGLARWCQPASVYDRPYLLLEYIEGSPALQIMSTLRMQGEWPAVGHLCGKIAAAYERLHASGVLHGDVHPRNVLLDAELTPTVIDFGCAAQIDQSNGCTSVLAPLSAFLSPEAAALRLAGLPQSPPNPEMEQYSVAAMLWFLMTGEHHIAYDRDPDTQLRQIVRGELRPFAVCHEGALNAVHPVLCRALATSAKRRFSSMGEFAERLRRVLPS